MPEVGDFLGIADGCRVFVGDDSVFNDAVEKGLRAIDIVDAGAAAGGRVEVVGMPLVDEVEVGGGGVDVVVDQQA